MNMENLNQQLESRLNSLDATVRRIALINLVDDEDLDIAEPFLVNALKDSASEVRAEAALLLEAYDSESAVVALLDGLNDESEVVRFNSAQSLSAVKNPQVGSLLIKRIGSPDKHVKAAIFRALRELRLPASMGPAIDALTDINADVRREAVAVLGWLKECSAIDLLAKLATSDQDIAVRKTAVGALGFAQTKSAQDALLAALDDRDWQVREEAATVIGKANLTCLGGQLVKLLADEYWQVALRAARSLGRLKHAEAVDSLLPLLKSGVSNLRKEVALTLSEVGSKKALPALEEAVHDPDPDVRKAARLAYATIISIS
jgi:HEAT repeat protein